MARPIHSRQAAVVESLEARRLLSISFVPRISNPGIVGYRPTLGDINGDGHDDLVTISESTTVYIYYGHGDGHFNSQPDASLLAGTAITGIALADFDHDGKLDLAFSNSGNWAAGVVMVRNLGNGHFAERFVVPAGNIATGVVTSDFNRDGNADLLFANAGLWSPTGGTPQYGAALLLGNGDFTFQPLRQIVMDAPQWSVSWPLPVVNSTVATSTATTVVFSNFSDYHPEVQSIIALADISHFDAPIVKTFRPVVGRIYGFAIGDVNNDGRYDLMVEQNAVPTPNQLHSTSLEHTFLGQPDGSFVHHAAVEIPVAVQYWGPMLADFDRDGKLDLIASGLDDSHEDVYIARTFVLAGLGDGTFVRVLDSSAVQPNRVLVDVNGDGLTDIFEWKIQSGVSLQRVHLNTSISRTAPPADVALFADALRIDELKDLV